MSKQSIILIYNIKTFLHNTINVHFYKLFEAKYGFYDYRSHSIRRLCTLTLPSLLIFPTRQRTNVAQRRGPCGDRERRRGDLERGDLDRRLGERERDRRR